MAKSIKLKNNNYIDSTGIVHNRNKLNNILDNISTNINNISNDITSLSNNITTLFNTTEVKDYTSRCNFTNSTYERGIVVKIGRIVAIQVSVISKITNSWGILFTIPQDLYPLAVFDGGISMNGAWVYGTGAGNGAGNVRASVTNGTRYTITGMYISNS